MNIRRPFRVCAAALAVAVLVSGCKSDADRLSEYRSSGLEYAANGDQARAIIQYRNALKIDPDDAETRAAIAQAFLAQGTIREAEQEFTLLSERFPDTLEFRSKLGEIALMRADWDALERQAEAADQIDAEALETQALRLAVRYRNARREGNRPRQNEISATAQALLEQRPAQPVLLRIAIENIATSDDPTAALPVLDAALAADPRSPELQLLRISLLADADQMDVAQDRLLDLARLYPDDPRIAGLLVARYMSRGRVDDAEAVLRALADGSPISDVSMRTMLVRFLKSTRGSDAALIELSRLIDEADDSPAAVIYAAMDRSIRFDMGDRDGAIEGLRRMLDDLGNAPETRIVQVLLARMHDRLGDRPAARILVNAALEMDPGEIEALKLRATWAIDEERPKDAIVDLRNALAQRPRDTELMTLLAAAHAQDGTRGLALEQLAAAAEVSGNAARESERYARALVTEGREFVATRVLDVAHSAAPGDIGVAVLLADLRMAQSDWAGVTNLLSSLRRIDDPEAISARATIEAALLLSQGREAGTVVDGMLSADPGRQVAFTRLISGLVARGDLDVARAQMDRATARRPGDVALRLLDGDLYAAEGDPIGAEDIYRALLDEPAAGDTPALRLFSLLAGQGRRDDADALLANALAAYPASRPLRLIESNRLDVIGETAGAIALLETLYAENASDPVVANNLATLLSAEGADPAQLERAARIVAPLQGNADPAVSDTIGWIAFQRGDATGALPLMRRAARGLPQDPQVQLRLGQVLMALSEMDEARSSFETVLTLAAEDHPVARAAQAKLQALGG